MLQSEITLIENGRIFYRGQDALHLARTATFEDVVNALWQTEGPSRQANSRAVALPPALNKVISRLDSADRLAIALAYAARMDRRGSDSSGSGLAVSGWRILRTLLAATTLEELPRRRSIAAHLAAKWKTRHKRSRELVDAALILCADHELNVSAFAVRVVASAGSPLCDAVLAGLCALRGERHGGQTDRVERMLDEAGSPQGLQPAIERRLGRKEHVPGFGHPLYADGDPRAHLLCELILEAFPSSPAARWTEAILHSGSDLVGDFPTLDVGLVLLRRALNLPRGSALLLFALGRTAGWIAHAMEQYAAPELIRPRALYSGKSPFQRP